MPDQPADPAAQTAEVRAMLTEPSPSGAAAVDYGPEEPSSKEAALKAAEALTNALTVETAKTSELTGELAVAETQSAIERGLPPEEVLGAALSSGAVDPAAVDELAWSAALAEQGLTDEELAELDDPELDDEIDARYEQVMGEAAALGQYETAAKRAQQEAKASFDQQVSNHKQSVEAMRQVASDLGLSGAAWDAHLAAIDRACEAGLLGPQVSLDALAANDPELFSATLYAVSATLRQAEDEQEAMAIKQNVFGSRPEFASGWTIDGQPAGPEPYVPTLDEDRYVDAVARRSLSRSRTKSEDLLPPPRPGVRDGYTSDGRKVSADDIPSGEDGLTPRQRLKREQRTGRAG